MLELYDLCGKNNLRLSPPCWSVKLCLIHKEINFCTVPVRFSEKEKIAFSGQGLVPILKYKNGFICDSWEIIKWLDQNYNQKKLFMNTSNKNFSYFLYYWAARQLLPLLFKIIAHEIPNVLDEKDIDYYIKTREKVIKGPITKFKYQVSNSILEFRKSIDPIRKIIEVNGYLGGKKPSLEDYIFFGNFMWVYTCSSCNLLKTNDPVYNWYKNISKIAEKAIN